MIVELLVNAQRVFDERDTAIDVSSCEQELPYEADTTPAFDQTFMLELLSEQNAKVATPATSITIVDDDFAGVSVLDASVVENAGKVVVPLLLSRSSLRPITDTWEARAGSAVAGSDFASASGTITVTATNSSITIPIVNDSLRETTEAFEVVLTSITGGKLERSSAAVVIVDDDTSDTPPAPRRRTAGH